MNKVEKKNLEALMAIKATLEASLNIHLTKDEDDCLKIPTKELWVFPSPHADNLIHVYDESYDVERRVKLMTLLESEGFKVSLALD